MAVILDDIGSDVAGLNRIGQVPGAVTSMATAIWNWVLLLICRRPHSYEGTEMGDDLTKET